MRSCLLFPGQGAQFIGMGKDLFEADSEVRAVFQAASEAAGFDLPALVFQGSEDELKRTSVAQVALATVEASVALMLRKRGFKPDAVAGFSLGEWPAIAEAACISVETMLRLVAARGRLMDEAGERSGGSGMAAVIGLAPDAVEAALSAGGVAGIWVANRNAPTQAVVSGSEAGLAAAEPVLKAAGARRYLRLKVSGAFHSPIMGPAHDAFAELLEAVVFADPRLDFFSNVSGGLVRSGAEIKRLAASQVLMPVRWIDEEAAIAASGVTLGLEAGPGTVLAGLMKAAYPELSCSPCGTLAEIEAIVESQKAGRAA